MNDQTTLDTIGSGESENCVAGETSDDRSGRRSSPEADGNPPIDILRSTALDQWITNRIEAGTSYGYLHLLLVAQSDLSGVQRELRFETRV